MSKKAFITGISGQDGSYLAEHLVELGYEVHGIIRRNSIPEHQESRINYLENNIKTYYGDLTDFTSMQQLIQKIQPDEIYNLGAQSHVRISFEIPIFTSQTNALGTLNMLEIYKTCCPESKFYQASSSEMFGNSVDLDGYQRETTPMNPVSPYGCTKVFGYNITRNYRKSYNLFISNGILFNHESPRRGSNFVSNKIIKAAVRIKKGLQKNLELGNLDAYRDWGHSKDYVKAMRLILNHDVPDDFVVATGESKSIREMCVYVFNSLGMNYENYVIQNEKFLRPEELPYLKGDSTKIRETLGWKPEYTFESMMDEMINYTLSNYSNV
jgi:GDPmannose 4,6-dehydratase